MHEASLRERKQQRAREEIVAAAYDLFAERGYADVTVADIAERAQVGRTTFFRYFGDKQEVVFANDQDWLDGLVLPESLSGEGKPTFGDAIALLRAVAERICAAVTSDPELYVRRERLLAENPELEDRNARKHRAFAERMRHMLAERGASSEAAVLGPRLALACYYTGRELAGGDPAALWPNVAAAFDAIKWE
ncbi:TetR/AcrR family transcriptional regulator [Dactylosporangium sp. NPDC048998]|uniref:TetR/AcrR family transcriptional regulator n=1 Tax=Dactylosporangium sp. NPDC048998 TaxID=3363976 RepID=UPI0037233B16